MPPHGSAASGRQGWLATGCAISRRGRPLLGPARGVHGRVALRLFINCRRYPTLGVALGSRCRRPLGPDICRQRRPTLCMSIGWWAPGTAVISGHRGRGWAAQGLSISGRLWSVTAIGSGLPSSRWERQLLLARALMSASFNQVFTDKLLASSSGCCQQRAGL